MVQKQQQKISAQTIADFFLTKKALSPKKIQKLVYYAYAWYIALYNQDVNNIDQVLFIEEPEAWMHGPVFPSLYRKYKGYGWREVAQRDDNTSVIFSDDLSAFLNDVWDKYGQFTADQLEFMTHQETPWQKARAGANQLDPSTTKISKQDIFIFYNEQAATS